MFKEINTKLDELSRRYVLIKLLKQVKRKSRLFLIWLIFLIKNYSEKDVVLVFSSPRGGSTWLLEMIVKLVNDKKRPAALFEPLHPIKGIVPKKLKSVPGLPPPDNITEEEYKRLFKGIFSGKKISNYSTRSSTILDFLFSKLVVVKFIHGNLLLPWLTSTFDFKHKPIYLLRHPVATAMSQHKAFYKNDELRMKLDRYKSKNFDQKQINYVLNLKTKMEQLIGLWCLYNSTCLRNTDTNLWYTIFYEELILDPKTEIRRLFSAIGLELQSFDETKFRKPSETDFRNDLKKDPAEQLKKWQKKYTTDELQKFQEILDFFEIKKYTCYNFMPIKN